MTEKWRKNTHTDWVTCKNETKTGFRHSFCQRFSWIKWCNWTISRISGQIDQTEDCHNKTLMLTGLLNCTTCFLSFFNHFNIVSWAVLFQVWIVKDVSWSTNVVKHLLSFGIESIIMTFSIGTHSISTRFSWRKSKIHLILIWSIPILYRNSFNFPKLGVFIVFVLAVDNNVL